MSKYGLLFNFLKSAIGPDCARKIIYQVFCDDQDKYYSRSERTLDDILDDRWEVLRPLIDKFYIREKEICDDADVASEERKYQLGRELNKLSIQAHFLSYDISWFGYYETQYEEYKNDYNMQFQSLLNFYPKERNNGAFAPSENKSYIDFKRYQHHYETYPWCKKSDW